MNRKTAATKVVIFGASLSGCSAFSELCKLYDVLAFADNDCNRHGSQINNLPVIAPFEIAALQPDKILIASEFFEQIQAQLSQLVPHIQSEILPARVIKPLQLKNSHRQGQTAVDLLLMLSESLSLYNVPHYIDAGTLLGVYRDNALIPWDDDLDFSVNADFLTHTTKVITQLLPKMYAITGVTWSLEQYINRQTYGAVPIGAVRALKLLPNDKRESLPSIDFFVKYIHGQNMDYCLASRGFRMPSAHFKQTHRHEFAGGFVNLPHATENYLSSHYGDWQTPQKDWSLNQVKSATVFKRQNV